jgi:myo-inositol-1(or 4)-monophosphatase
MKEFAQLATDLARRAGALQKTRFGSDLSVAFKGEIDLVTDVDQACEALIVAGIRSRYPDHEFLAEENSYPETGSPWRWIIDPLDGTTNYAHGFPWFAVSIALEYAGQIRLGVVYHPMLDEMFTAVRGKGALLNGAPIHVTRRAAVSEALLATGFPYDRAWDNENNFARFLQFQVACRGIRRAGSAALDLAYVAAGRLDGYWECKLKPWDMAAGQLLVEEAGGMVTDFAGMPHAVRDHRILASNGLIHDEMLAQLAAAEAIRITHPPTR